MRMYVLEHIPSEQVIETRRYESNEDAIGRCKRVWQFTSWALFCLEQRADGKRFKRLVHRYVLISGPRVTVQ